VDTVLVQHEALQRFLQPIDIDKRYDKDGTGAMCKFEYSWMHGKVLLR